MADIYFIGSVHTDDRKSLAPRVKTCSQRGHGTCVNNKGFHVGDARVKKLTAASKRSIGRHVEF